MKKIIQLTALLLTVGGLLIFETSTSATKFNETRSLVSNDNQNGKANRANRNGNVNGNRNSDINGNSNGNSNFKGTNSNRGDDDDDNRQRRDGRRGRRGRGKD